MNSRDISKLNSIIVKRKAEMSSIVNFEELFSRFSRLTLKRVCDEVNSYLSNGTNDVIKVLNEDPFELIRNKHFVQVKLMINLSRNNSMYSISFNDNDPTLRFAGKQIDGTVEISRKLINEAGFTQINVVKVDTLTDEIVSNLVIDFIDAAYSS